MLPIRNDKGASIKRGQIRDLSGAVSWLRQHGLEFKEISYIFSRSVTALNVSDWRKRHGPGTEPTVARRVQMQLAETENSVSDLLSHAATDERPLSDQPLEGEVINTSARDLSDEVEEFAPSFWQNVRFLKGAARLGEFRRRVNAPGSDNILLIRTGGRVNHLLAELHLHAGYCTSAIAFGIEAFEWEKKAYRSRATRSDLERIGKTALLISNALIIARKFDWAKVWVGRARDAFVAASSVRYGERIDPELYRQLGAIQLLAGQPHEAIRSYREAGQRLAVYKPGNSSATQWQVRDIEERPQNFIRQDWEKSFELFEYAKTSWPADDIHVAINLLWSAACALRSDSAEARKRAQEQLKNSEPTQGYGQQVTRLYLLSLTERIPNHLRNDWILFSLYYNAFRNK